MAFPTWSFSSSPCSPAGPRTLPREMDCSGAEGGNTNSTAQLKLLLIIPAE